MTEQLTSAHEDRSPEYSYEYKEVEMDLFNNNIGREIGNQSTIILMMKVKFALENGDLRYLNNLNPINNEATSNSQLIPTAQ